MAYVLAEVTNQIGTLTFNHDAHRNALSKALTDEFLVALERLSAARVRAVVLRARPGTKVWSAGHDLRELPKTGADPLAYSDPVERIIRAVQYFPAPVLGMIDGSVWGGAFELALVCDLLVGTRNATFA